MISAQEFIKGAISDKMPEGEELEGIKYLAGDSRLKIKNYPAVIVESEPFDYNQLVKNNKISLVKDACNLIVLSRIRTPANAHKNWNDYTDEDLSYTKTELKGLTDKIISVIIDKAKETNGISDPEFGRAEDDIVSIDSKSIMILTIAVSIFTKNDFSNT